MAPNLGFSLPMRQNAQWYLKSFVTNYSKGSCAGISPVFPD